MTRMPQAARHGHLPLFAIVLLGFLLRLGTALPGIADAEIRFSRPDSETYLEPARALAESGGYLEAPGSPRPATLRPPGLPALLSILLRGGAGVGAVVVVLCLLGALIAVPVYACGSELGGRAAGILAALLFSLNLTAIANAPLILSDTVFTLIVAGLAVFVLRYHRRGRLVDAGVAATLAAAAALVRSIGLPFGVVVAALLLAPGPAVRSRRLLATALFLVLFGTLVAPWMARNAALGAGFRIDTNAGNTLLENTAAAVLAVEQGESEELVRERLRAETAEVFAGDPEAYSSLDARVSYQLSRGRQILMEHPVRTALLHVQPVILLPDVPTFLEDLGITTSGRGTQAVIRQHGFIRGVRHYFGDRIWILVPLLPALAVVALTYLGGLGTLVAWARGRRIFFLFLFGGFVLFFIVLPGPMIMPRYHLPALPLLCAMAGAGLTAIRRRG